MKDLSMKLGIEWIRSSAFGRWSFWALILVSLDASGQGSGLPLGSTNYGIIDRLSIKTGQNPEFNTALKTYTRGEAVSFALSVEGQSNLSERDKEDLRRIYLDNNECLVKISSPKEAGLAHDKFIKTGEDSLGGIYRLLKKSQEIVVYDPKYELSQKPFLGVFFKTPANLLSFTRPGFHLRLNPLLNFQVAKPNRGEVIFFNQRGLELRGGIDNKVYFYTNITENLARFPGYVNDFIAANKAIPGNGFYKDYKSAVIDSKGAYDYNNGQGHIGFHLTKSIRMEFGHGKNFIGNGYRSLLLSDFSHNYLYLKTNWRLWRLNYQNLFTEFQATSAQDNPSKLYIPRKYMAAHYLSFDVTKNLTFGMFEATVFKRDTSSGEGFELQYLNPVILYRSVEHLLDSKDNIILGADLKWNLFKTIGLYGQMVVDEFRFTELKKRSGWWGNKVGYQLGAKYIDALKIDHLDLQVEFNTVRPYTYTHQGKFGASYAHYNQALAHPLGANFKEVLLLLRYQLFKRWTVEGRTIMARYGTDGEGENWGGNILLDYDTHPKEFGNETGQGIDTKLLILGLDLSWEVWHNLNLDLSLYSHNKKLVEAGQSIKNAWVGMGVRWNAARYRLDF